MSEGDLLIVFPNTVHSYTSEESVDVGKFIFSPHTLPELHDVSAPSVDNHLGVRDVGEHNLPLLLGHGNVRAEGGHHVDLDALRRKEPVVDARDETGVGMVAREVRGDYEHVLKFAPLEGLFELDGDLIVRQAFRALCNRKKIHSLYLSFKSSETSLFPDM